LYRNKLFELFDNLGDGLCLLDSVSSFTAPDAVLSRPNFVNKKQDRGYDYPYVVQFLLEFLCTLSKKDFDAILSYYSDGDDTPVPTLSSEYKKFAKKN
jgi:hypothetical protein